MPIQATPIPVSGKRTIDLHAALLSTLRSWFAARDTALWCFVSGTDGAGLEEPNLSDISRAVGQMGLCRSLAIGFASQLSDKNNPSAAIIQSALRELLDGEEPIFLLQLPSVEGSF